MAMSVRSRFVAFAAVPVTVLSVAAAAAFTFGQDVSQLNGTQEQADYLVVASNTTSSANSWTQKAYIGGAPGLTGSVQNVTVTTKYGELPQWFQVDSGAVGVPSAVQEPGDLAFINGASSTTTPEDTNNGGLTGGTSNLDVVQAIHVKGNITNVAALRQAYGSCLIPIRLWSTTDDGTTFADVTADYLDTQARYTTGTNGQGTSTANPGGSTTDPFYVDCATGEFEFTVPTDIAADHKTAGTLAYEVSVERGGVFASFNNDTGAQPEFVFQATPIAYDPTNQFNNPGSYGNAQYTANLKSAAAVVPPGVGSMTLTARITTTPTTVAMPLFGTVTDISINWGDGTITGPFNAAGDQSHVYANTGNYTISISGTKLQAFGHYGNTVTGAETITAVNNWGAVGLEGFAFSDMTGLTAVPTTLPATVTSLEGAFNGASSFNQNIGGWDTSNVTNMFAAFINASAFNQPIGGWDTSNVNNMRQMFNGASSFNQSVGNWNVGNVGNMDYMFANATTFNQNLGGWNIRNVQLMGAMLNGTALSSANYGSTLVGWQGQTHQSTVPLGASGLTYPASASTARAALVTDGWTITDAGPTP